MILSFVKYRMNFLNLSIKTIIYISYDGMMEPLGQSQVLAYLMHLTTGRRIHLVSFEKTSDLGNIKERNRIANDIEAAGIIWHPLTYHKWPSVLATSWDILCGIIVCLSLVFRHKVTVIHTRSYVPSIMAMVIRQVSSAKFIFDMRGFWADEKVDGGSWSHGGLMYKVTKWFERRFLLTADHVVSLTHAAITEMEKFPYLIGFMPPVTVIPTCADLYRFTPIPKAEGRDSDKGFTLGYVGSVGTYYLFDEVLASFLQLRLMRSEARLLIVNRGQHKFLRERLFAAGVPDNVVELTSAAHEEMPKQISRMDAGVFFIKPVFSKQASAPTKLAEFLGCGIPCLTNAGVGDMAEVLDGEQVGVAIRSFDDESIKFGVQQLLELVDNPDTQARCVSAAQKNFSLNEGVTRYRRIYALLGG